MPTVDQRLTVLEERVASLEDAYERNMEFVGKKLVEHAVRLDRIEQTLVGLDRKVESLDHKVDVLDRRVQGIQTGIDALPKIIAQTISEELDRRERSHTA